MHPAHERQPAQPLGRPRAALALALGALAALGGAWGLAADGAFAATGGVREKPVADALVDAILACEPEPLACPGMKWAVLRRMVGDDEVPVISAGRRRFVRPGGREVAVLGERDLEVAARSGEELPVLFVRTSSAEAGKVDVNVGARQIDGSGKARVYACGAARFSVYPS